MPPYPFSSPRSLFLSSMGACYVAAFVSLWLQFPGLLGSDGLLPAGAYWRRLRGASARFAELPCLLWLLEDGDDVELALEGLIVLGAVVGCAVTAGVHHGSAFLFLFLAYLSCFLVGQTFLSFQWDLFLLETGASLVLYAPWWSLSSRAHAAVAHPMTWVLRAQWVKFMLCSGVVKVTANCPTWKGLTALEYHFASTCLPTAEAWFHHSLPPFVLRIAVAFMFLCELVAPWLLLAPITAVRRVGCAVQLPLQVAIAYTGNYNWFNMHTAALLLPAWERDAYLPSPRAAAPDPRAAAPREAVEKQPLLREANCKPRPSADDALARVGRMAVAPMRAWERMWASRLGCSAASAATLIGLAVAAARLFPVSYQPADASAPPVAFGASLPLGLSGLLSALGRPDALTVQNRATSSFVRWLLSVSLQPATFGYLFSMLTISAVGFTLGGDETHGDRSSDSYDDDGYAPVGTDEVGAEATAAKEARRPPDAAAAAATGLGSRAWAAVRWSRCVSGLGWRALVCAMSLLWLGVTLLPLGAITGRSQAVVPMLPSWGGIRSRSVELHAALEPFHCSNAYGLFRRMTGVGAASASVRRGVPEVWGWGGLEPSIVSVPAVVLEGTRRRGETEEEWVEIAFRYAPYKEERPPRRTAPHQPRLDWQMWFAALGSYQHNPWLLHLIYKILRGVPNATASGGGDDDALALLDLDAYPFRTKPPALVRARLMHYDFTRAASPWAARISDAPVLPANCSSWWGWPDAGEAALGRAADGSLTRPRPCAHWWRRLPVREYVPPVSRQMLLEQVVLPQGWPEHPPASASERCAAKAAARRAVPGWACRAVASTRRAGAPLRRFVGLEIHAAASSHWPWFVDGPLSVITGATLASAALGVACFNRRRGRPL